jgi:hypothetical protein
LKTDPREEEFEDTKRGNHNISKKNIQHKGHKDKHTYKNKITLHITTEKRTSHYKRYAKPYMSPTGTNITNKGLHIKVQKVCKAVYEPHRDKQNKQRISH